MKRPIGSFYSHNLHLAPTHKTEQNSACSRATNGNLVFYAWTQLLQFRLHNPIYKCSCIVKEYFFNAETVITFFHQILLFLSFGTAGKFNNQFVYTTEFDCCA